MRNKIFSIAASALAAIVMITALVYYNFIDKVEAPEIAVEVDDECPDFTVTTYKIENGEFKTGGAPFTLSENLGKIVIVNFWATWCIPCKAELPEFNRLQETYKEEVVVLAVDTDSEVEELAAWLNSNKEPVNAGWKEFSLLFSKYGNEQNIFTMFGFSSQLPSTVIVNREGVVTFKAEGKMEYDALEEQILPLL